MNGISWLIFRIPWKQLFFKFWQFTIDCRINGLNEFVKQVISTPWAREESCSIDFFRIEEAIRRRSNSNLGVFADAENEDTDLLVFHQFIGSSYNVGFTPQHFEFHRLIGKGTLGTVYLARHWESNCFYTIKVNYYNQFGSRVQFSKLWRNIFPASMHWKLNFYEGKIG